MGRVLAAVALLAGCTGSIGDARAPEGGASGPDVEPPLAFPETPFSPVTPVVRRLTNAELANTLADVTSEPIAEDVLALLPAVQAEGFETVATGQSVSEAQARAFQAVARLAVNTEGFARLAWQTRCERTDVECGTLLLGELGLRLFRRPLEERELDLFLDLFLNVGAEGLSYGRAARAVGEAMIQSPPFLYLLEDERSGLPLRGFAMASRLSYLVWASAPDDALYEAAADGRLDRPEGVLEELERLLDDPRAGRVHARFLEDWARLGKIPDEDGRKAELIASATAFYAEHAA
ncbi:MAG: DUF1592 domain-containing protein, partial [Myxococcota bacterium]